MVLPAGYNIAVEAINNPAGFGLQKSFYMVNVGTNDRNNEILLYADHNSLTTTMMVVPTSTGQMVMRLATLRVGCAVGTIPSWRHPKMQQHGMHSVLYSVKLFRERTVLGSRWLLLSRYDQDLRREEDGLSFRRNICLSVPQQLG